MDPLLEIERLEICFPGQAAPVSVVRDVSFSVGVGEFVGLVGESGSGKTLTALSIVGLLPAGAGVVGGSIRFAGLEVESASADDLRRLRGGRVGFVFQEPASALHPVLPIGVQIVEGVRLHATVGRAEARRRAIELLREVAMPDPEACLRRYPHELSGGQLQRALIAVALSGEPELLVADEPTTALDVTLKREILELLERLRRERGLSVLLITHDLSVVAESCDRVVVLYAGEVAEEAKASELFSRPRHPYTRSLLELLPRLGERSGAGPSPSSHRLPVLEGQLPRADRLPRGCLFEPRCHERLARCAEERPRLQAIDGARAACFLHEVSS